MRDPEILCIYSRAATVSCKEVNGKANTQKQMQSYTPNWRAVQTCNAYCYLSSSNSETFTATNGNTGVMRHALCFLFVHSGRSPTELGAGKFGFRELIPVSGYEYRNYLVALLRTSFGQLQDHPFHQPNSIMKKVCFTFTRLERLSNYLR